MDINILIRKLAKQIKYQNLFSICKDLHCFKLFKNTRELSQIQDIFLNYLYLYDSIYQDLKINHISKHIFDNAIYEDAYLLWKKEKPNQVDTEEHKASDVKLVSSDTIKFPSSEVK